MRSFSSAPSQSSQQLSLSSIGGAGERTLSSATCGRKGLVRESFLRWLLQQQCPLLAQRHHPPVTSVDRSLTNERKAALAPEIAKQLNVSSVDVLQLFQIGGWSIVTVETPQSDEPFLFCARDPLASRYVTSRSGARSDEEPEIKDWALKNAPNIPSQLASCFAWHVTKDRVS